MKLWISLSILALVTLVAIYMQDENHSLSQSKSQQKLTADTTPAAPSIFPKYHSASNTAKPAKHDFVSPVLPKEEPTPEVDTRPDLLTWSKPVEQESDMILRLQQTEEDRINCPVVMVTYGENPKPNVKVEQRKEPGKNFDSTGCPAPSSDFIVSRDQ